MPTYAVTTTNLVLSNQQKSEIAKLIASAHSAHTGAPGYFAQIMFTETAAGDHFIGGEPNVQPTIYVHGIIRAGRTTEAKQGVMSAVRDGIRDTTGIGVEEIWVYIQDLAPEQMIEYGRFLPAPGAEAAWRAGFSPAKLTHFEQAGLRV